MKYRQKAEDTEYLKKRIAVSSIPFSFFCTHANACTRNVFEHGHTHTLKYMYRVHSPLCVLVCMFKVLSTLCVHVCMLFACTCTCTCSMYIHTTCITMCTCTPCTKFICTCTCFTSSSSFNPISTLSQDLKQQNELMLETKSLLEQKAASLTSRADSVDELQAEIASMRVQIDSLNQVGSCRN